MNQSELQKKQWSQRKDEKGRPFIRSCCSAAAAHGSERTWTSDDDVGWSVDLTDYMSRVLLPRRGGEEIIRSSSHPLRASAKHLPDSIPSSIFP